MLPVMANLSDVAKDYVKKGARVYIEGRNVLKAYVNKEGTAIPSEQLIASTLEIQKFADKQADSQPEDVITARLDSTVVYKLI